MILPALILFLASLCNAAVRFPPHGVTLAPRAINTSIPTVTLAPVTNFNQALPNGLSVSATGSQIELITDVASLNGDALVLIGADAATNLETVYQENCPNGLDSPNCEASLQVAMNVDQQMFEPLQKRVAIFIPIVVVILAIEYAIIQKNEDAIVPKPSPISVMRIPSPNLAKPSLVQGAKTVVFATQTEGGNLITVVPSPTVDSAGQISFAIVTANNSLSQKGDWIFETPSQPGYALYQFVQTYGKCPQLPCNEYNLAGYVAGQAIPQVGPEGILSDLSNMPTDISSWDLSPPLMAQLPQVQLFGKQVSVLAANSTLLNAVAKFLLLGVYAELTDTAPNPTKLVIAASNIVTAQNPQETGSECPGQIPNCSNCGGNKLPPSDPVNTDGICVGLKQYDMWPVGCVCVDPNDMPPYAPYDSLQEINEALAWLADLAANANGLAEDGQNPGGATSTSGSIPPSASSTSSPELTTFCKNDARYTEPLDCDENCFAGKCTPVKVARRCEGCNNGDQTLYQCTC